jgi:dihydroorotase
MHVHFRDPGFEYKEDIASGARAATHGGFTDVATMPNTDPICDTGTTVRYQIDRGKHAGLTRVHPVGALTTGEKGEALAEIGDMVHAGACGFSDDGHGVQRAGMMRTCMEYVSQFDRCVIAHCQDDSLTANGVINEGRASTRLGMFGWPALGEELEVMRDIELCRLTGCPLHIAHISTARSLELVRAAKADGLPVTCEVTPHNLLLTEENITDAYNTNLKVNPPLRTRDDAAALVEGLATGVIDCVVSDHAPHAAHEKDCEFEIAYFGTIGLETTVPVLLTHLVEKGFLTWERLVDALSVKPRALLRLEPVAIAPGNTADITVIDPAAEVVVTEDYFESRSKNSAFLGERLKGAASDVFVGGKHTLVNGVVA